MPLFRGETNSATQKLKKNSNVQQQMQQQMKCVAQK